MTKEPRRRGAQSRLKLPNNIILFYPFQHLIYLLHLWEYENWKSQTGPNGPSFILFTPNDLTISHRFPNNESKHEIWPHSYILLSKEERFGLWRWAPQKWMTDFRVWTFSQIYENVVWIYVWNLVSKPFLAF